MIENDKVNIVIRCLNEGKWLKICLNAIMHQTYQNFVITIVDSGSNDATLDIARQFGTNIIKIKYYKPGKAINMGLSARTDCKFGVILSGHCVPCNTLWLNNLVQYIKGNKLPGVYGRQLPMNFTNSDDVRDLAITFPSGSNFSSREFFHNANSIIDYKIWRKYKFNDEVSHIEDLVWAKQLTNVGLKIGYCSQACVTHHHGIHQHGVRKSFRSDGLLTVIKSQNLTKVLTLGQLIKKYSMQILEIYNSERPITKNPSVKLSEISTYSNKSTVKELIQDICKYSCNFNKKTIGILLNIEITNPNTALKTQKKYFSCYPNAVIPAVVDYGNYWISKKSKLIEIQNSYDSKLRKNKILKGKLMSGSVIGCNTGYNDPNLKNETLILEI
jgi:glycosyltransferase involved in cell wall biosynthesis